jgi:prepilin-type N-terminal cleavage/methylation domain-containing protein/prepilin-type processing-associated H-X9-DG protein
MMKRRGFTLVELLVVIAIIVILLSMLAPTMGRVMYMVDMDICYSNVHQLSTAWTANAADNKGVLVNGSTHGARPWAKHGDENASNADRDSLITTGALFPWTKETGIYLCPADSRPHIRSYSICSMMNGNDWGDMPYVTRFKYINDPTNQMVFVEENDRRSISNMGTFAQDPLVWGKNRWVDYVANFHEGSDNVGFADGHAENWTWVEAATLKNSADEAFFRPDNGNRDLRRIRKHFFNEMEGAY